MHAIALKVGGMDPNGLCCGRGKLVAGRGGDLEGVWGLEEAPSGGFEENRRERCKKLRLVFVGREES
jgi:hypothetical protein